MTFQELIHKRQSVRRFNPEKSIEQTHLNLILEAARLAPSACNSQPWTFIAVTDEIIKHQVAKATESQLIKLNTFVVDAAALIVIVLEKPKVVTQIGGAIKNKDYPLIDIGIAASHINLQAEELGIGSCILGWFDEKKIKNILNIPNRNSVGLVVALGYAADGYKQRIKIRKPFNIVAKYNGYQ